MTTDRDTARLDVLDAVRAVAALMVYWSHTGTAVVRPPLVVYGSTGVYLFFVLSGYLLVRPYLDALAAGRPLPPAGPFYLRRLVRIGPPYLVCLALFSAARYATGDKPPGAGNFAAHAVLVFNYLPAIDFYSINGVFWTLAIEAQFYLLLPPLVWLVARFTRGRAGGTRCAAVAAAFIVLGVGGRVAERELFAVLYGADSQVVYRSIFSYLDLFGYGMAVGVLERSGARPGGRVGAAFALAVAAAMFLVGNNLAFTSGGQWMETRDRALAFAFPPLVTVAMAVLLWVVLTPRASRWPGLNNAPLRFVGRISYSVYLYHLGVQFVLFKRVDLTAAVPDFYLRGFVYGWVFLVPTLALSAVMFFLVEKPCLDWIARRRSPRTPPS
jgi:peptidoglycan/LPS O-acetylase OafA/YrhL